jgi:hypothetical protein
MTMETEDYRAKNAREGRAVYVPGRTVEETAADAAREAEHKARVLARSVSLPNAIWEALDTAIPDTIEFVADAKNVLIMVSSLDDLDQPGINSLMRIAAKAAHAFEENELVALDQLDTGIRSARNGGFEQ